MKGEKMKKIKEATLPWLPVIVMLLTLGVTWGRITAQIESKYSTVDGVKLETKVNGIQREIVEGFTRIERAQDKIFDLLLKEKSR